MVLQFPHHRDENVVYVTVEFAGVLDQTFQSPVGATPLRSIPQTEKDEDLVISGVLEILFQLIDERVTGIGGCHMTVVIELRRGLTFDVNPNALEEINDNVRELL